MRIIMVFFIWIIPELLLADQLHGIINGKAYHFNRSRNLNESNWGVGFEYNFDKRGNWIPLLTGSTFKDSNDQTSNYLGGGVKHRFMLGLGDLHLDIGGVAFAMTRKDFKNNKPFLGALPFISLGNESVAVNTTYIPKISPKHVRLIYFQLVIKIADF